MSETEKQRRLYWLIPSICYQYFVSMQWTKYRRNMYLKEILVYKLRSSGFNVKIKSICVALQLFVDFYEIGQFKLWFYWVANIQ